MDAINGITKADVISDCCHQLRKPLAPPSKSAEATEKRIASDIAG
jgi:hypothetical protein